MDPDWTPRPLDLLLGFQPGRATNAAGWQWHPAHNRYRTEGAYWNWRSAQMPRSRWAVLSRRINRGIRNAACLATGRRLVRTLIERGEIDMADVPEKDQERAEEALSYCAGLVKDNDAEHKHRLAAASTLLAYVKAKPTQKVETTLRTAESFLDDIED